MEAKKRGRFVDANLLLASQQLLKGNTLCSRFQEQLEKQLHVYETACRLSQGRDERRSKHWTVRAFDEEVTLRKFVDALEDDVCTPSQRTRDVPDTYAPDGQ